MLYKHLVQYQHQLPDIAPPINFYQNIKQYDCFSIVNSPDYLDDLENPRFKTWMQFKTIIIFGTGGSSLGGQCINAISKNQNNKIIKFINNIDANTLSKIFSEIDLVETGFLCISKSGETLETIAQVLLSMQKIYHLPNFHEHFVVVTEDKKSSLKALSNKFDFLCFDHPKSIGGRYSVFSLVGMIPAIIAGINPHDILIGARSVLDDFENSIAIQDGVKFIAQNFRNNISQHVSFIYSDQLIYFGQWIAQLYAESSGKNGVGITPLTAIGSTDQHSQLQLYLDGSKDKCFTFFVETKNSDLLIDSYIPEAFSYLKGKTISDIFKAQSKATIASCVEKKLPVRVIEIPEIDPQILGAMFMHFMLEIVCVCKLFDINPFDQPAVESGKIMTKSILEDANDFKI